MSKPNIKPGISLYSFQEKYYFGAMTLEACVATAGVRGRIKLAIEVHAPHL